jgi:prophage regulatory protein
MAMSSNVYQNSQANVIKNATEDIEKDRFLRLPDVMSRTGLSRSSLYEQMALGAFPTSIGLGGRSVAWLESEVVAWQKLRLQLRGARG